ncbi:MAG: VOC family protein [Cyclobacteriaceae bacterium]
MRKLIYTLVIIGIGGLMISTTLERHDAVSPRFNHVMLYVSDLEASIQFYTEAFDVELTQRVDEITRIDSDAETSSPVKMAFLKFPGQDFVFELSEREMNGSVSSHYQHVGIDVSDIEKASGRLTAAGASDFSGIHHLRANNTEVLNCFFKGPDGELIELMQILEGEF